MTSGGSINKFKLKFKFKYIINSRRTKDVSKRTAGATVVKLNTKRKPKQKPIKTKPKIISKENHPSII